MSGDAGPGKRLTEAQEARGAEMFSAGASERDVAEALGCSASTAHRLRERLQNAAPAVPAATVPAELGEPDATVAPEPDETAQALTALYAQRAGQAEVIEGLEQREATSLTAMSELKHQQLGELAEGRADVGLRERHKNAAEDAADWHTAADLARDKLRLIDMQIADLEARRALGAMRAELAAAVEARDAACAATGERQRAAVLAVRDAAAEFVQVVADEQAAVSRAADLAAAVTAAAVHLGEPVPEVPAVASTALWLHPDAANTGGALALARAINRAREGNVQDTAVQLATAFGWLPPDPAQIAAERERLLAMRAPEPEPEPRQPWTRPGTSSVPLDRDGNELPPWMTARPPHPSDAYPGTPAPTGWLGGVPWHG